MIELRDYQRKSIDTICSQFSVQDKQLCVLPTGSGKTVIFSNIINKLKLRTLVIAHTKEILDQTKRTLDSLFPNLKTSLYRFNIQDTPDVMICSLQSGSMGKTLEILKNHDYRLIIIDECHRAASEGYKKIINALKSKRTKLLGVTATPFRTDKKSVYEIFGFPTFSLSLIEMIELGFLVDFTGYKVKTTASLKGIRKANGDFVSSKLESVINVNNRNELIVQQYINLGEHRKTIAFCLSVQHALDLEQEFSKKGIICASVFGSMPNEKRRSILKRFKNGEIKVLTNCNILTEGFDEPSVSCLLMCRPTISKTLYMQMIGRGARISLGKKDCTVIEFTDNDYDVASLEDLIESNQPKIKMKFRESFREYAKRSEKILLESSGQTIVLPHENLISKNYMNRPASVWQINQLRERKIPFSEPLLEITANYLLKGG